LPALAADGTKGAFELGESVSADHTAPDNGAEGSGQGAGGADPGRSHLTFPDLPRLELDQLLSQLVDRAQEVMSTQGRLRGLLTANQLIITDLTLPVVLRRIVDAASDLVGARYAALGVISPDGGLSEFVHTGMPPDAVAQIGHLPEGKGLLGALIEDPHPIRLERIADDLRSSGFPPGHPPMNSFLGVPIRIRDEIYGNLYLAESTKGTFSAEDEELTSAIAATAAVAIENARLYESARTHGEWLQASAAITRELLAAPTTDRATHPLQLIAEHSREIAGADLVTVALPTGDAGDELCVEVAVGTGAARLIGKRVPLSGSLEGTVLRTGRPLRLAHPDNETRLGSVAPEDLDVGPVLVLPLVGSGRVQGVLSAARLRGRTAFSAPDLDMAGSFANHGAIAIELAQARAEQQRAAMLDERDRIAADLHDHVIQRLFAAGLSLQSVAMTLGPCPTTDRVLTTVADLDATITQIRTTIFQLHDLPRADPAGLRARLLLVATDAAKALGFEPAVRFTGAVDTLPTDIGEDLVAVLREALTNVARHAHAHAAEVDLTARPDRLLLTVRDDGIGITPTTHPSGLANLHRRAQRHGGTCDAGPRKPTGTVLTWSIPT
jgi:signal transduction histidine kinase